MTKVIHISTECYPAAKAGGMGDVVGALPLYLPGQGIEASVITPRYKRTWFEQQSFVTQYSGELNLDDRIVDFRIQRLEGTLPYPFYCVDIPGLFDREDIYLAENGHGYPDEPERNISFQLAILDWLSHEADLFDVFHCHDHMTGLIPFFLKCCHQFEMLSKKPTVFTIHNGQYRGIFDWSVHRYFPYYDPRHAGLLDWDGAINSLATAIKCSWVVNTVSPSYMQELINDFDTLTPLVSSEREKCEGIINGIDNELWDPKTDEFLDHHLKGTNWKSFKSKNKSALIKRLNLKSRRPLIGFIGRMATQKGADVLASSIEESLSKGLQFSTVILGSGDKAIEQALTELSNRYPRDISVTIAYDEKMARAIYAACDFLMMPSRFEPCGLNQMYAMRYGTIPMVSNVGGLKDTVPDISQKGNGIVAETIDTAGFAKGIERAVHLYKSKKELGQLVEKIMGIDWSWDQSAQKYAEMYQQLNQ
ncbi:MAG: glycogen/starch synthase [Saprospiraceae bacterium]|nr:glycogen/starch synthase [Saprospiraceae bacterium]